MIRNDGVFPRGRVGWLLLRVQLAVFSLWLGGVNLLSRKPITGEVPVDVSLTSFGPRLRRSVWKTLETIGRGSVRPRRVILWLDETQRPANLRRLERRGLEIRLCADYGPHKKYFPYVTTQSLDVPLVTADDDVFYPRNWLAELVAAQQPGTVVCHRARIRTDGPYASWPMCDTTEASDRVFATGVGGVLYPPSLLPVLRDRGTDFLQICPRADDFWLHYAAVAAGLSVRQVSTVAAQWWPDLKFADTGLWADNLTGNANDVIAEAARQAFAPPAVWCFRTSE